MSTQTLDRDLVASVAASLPGTWTAHANTEYSVTLRRISDGLTLNVYQQDGKTRISLSVPHEHVRYNEKRPAINVTLTEASVTRVARDIERRLLPDAEAMFATVQERIAARAAYDAGRAGVLARLGLFEDRAGNVRISEGAVWGDATVSDNSVTLNLHSLSPEDAAAILAIVRG